MNQEPAIACSLTQDQMKSRTDLAAEIGRIGLEDVSTSGPRADLRFSRQGTPLARIQEFVDVESSCCPFFEFALAERDEEIQLTITAPEDGAVMTRSLVAGFTDGWRLS